MKFIQKGEIPFIRLLAALIAGISLALWQMPDTAQLKTAKLLLLGAGLAFICFHIFYKKQNLYRFRWAGSCLVFLLTGLTGYLRIAADSQKLEETHFSKTRQDLLFAVISSEPKLNGDILRFEAEVKQRETRKQLQPACGKLLIALKLTHPQQANWQYGDLLLLPSSYHEIDPPYNPFEFNYKAYLANKSIYHQAFINSEHIRLIGRNQGNPVRAYALNLRLNLVKRFSQFIKNKDAAAVASTLILGYRADLSAEVLSAYAATGTMHILSVSGMHVGILFVVLNFCLRGMNKTQRLRLLKALILITLIWLYALITGFSAAVCRAAVMLSFIISGKAVRRHMNTYNLLAISAVLLLLYNPYFLTDVGFQLSYLAIGGLIYFYPPIYHAVYFQNFIGDKIWSCLSLSAAAQLATFPLSMYYFHQFPFYFLISNLFIILPANLMMYGGMAFALLPFDAISIALGQFLEKTIVFTNAGLSLIEHFPGSVLSGVWIAYWEYPLWYILIVLLFFSISYRQKKPLYFSLVLLLLLICNSSSRKLHQQSSDSIIFYSLRKNTAIGFIDGREATVLTDLRSSDKTFAFSVMPMLDANSITINQQLKPGGTLKNGNFISRDNFIQFKNWKMLVYDKRFRYQQAQKNIRINALLISGNPRLKLASLGPHIMYRQLLIDATNSDYNIRRWQKEAASLHISCYVLKKNPAFVVELAD